MPDINDVIKTLSGVPHSIGLTQACLFGATQGTAPADRWDKAAAHLAEAAAAIEAAQVQLAAVDKREPHCITCSAPVISTMQGWRHWGDGDIYETRHVPDMDWRPVAGTGAAEASGEPKADDSA